MGAGFGFKSRVAANLTGTAVATICVLVMIGALQRGSENWTMTAIVISSAAALLILLAALFSMRNALRAGMAAEAEVQRLNRELEQRVLERNRELVFQANLIEVAQDAVVVRAMDGTIHFWNKGAESLYGFTRDQAVGKVSHALLKTEFSL